MVKLVRESRLAAILTVRELFHPVPLYPLSGGTPWLELNTYRGYAKARLVAWQRLVQPALAS